MRKRKENRTMKIIGHMHVLTVTNFQNTLVLTRKSLQHL